MQLEITGSKGSFATLHLHWQADRLGRQAGLAFQTTEMIPMEATDWEAAKREAVAAFERARPNDPMSHHFLQGGKLLEENGQRHAVLKIPGSGR